MKILALSNMYPPDFIGGYELCCAQVVDALRDRGHDARVLTAAPRHPVDSPPHVLRRLRLIDEWSEDGMGPSPLAFRLDEAESRLVSAHNVYVLTKALEEFDPDVVYVNNVIGLGGLGLVACLQYLDVPWAWQLGDCVPRMLCTARGGVVRGLADEFTRRIVGHYIVVSQQLRIEIESSGALLKGEVAVLPNWITGAPDAPRTSYYRGGHLRIMTAVGQVSRSKGMDILIDAAAALRALGCDDFSLHIYGRSVDPYFTSLINKHGLQGHVTLMGVRPHRELMRLYGDYDVCAFPTHEREPFGMVPLEAVARGCVPVMTRRCGVAEWLVHGVHCLKAARQADAFAEIFHAIADGRIDLEPIARRGGAVAWRDFHLDAIVPKIERVLDAAARRPRAGAGAGTAADAYRLARMAEQLTRGILQDAACA